MRGRPVSLCPEWLPIPGWVVRRTYQG